MSDMDALVELAARAIEGDVEYVVPKRDGSPLTVAHVRLTHNEAVAVARAALSAALLAVGLPALTERMEAAEGEVEFYKSQTATWMNSYKQQVEGARELLADRDALAAKVADTGERIALAIEAQRVCCQDSYCSIMHQRTIDAAIARRGDV